MEDTKNKKEEEYSDQEAENVAEIPKEKRFIHTQPYDKSVSDLISMMRRKDITFDPDYQRNYIWNNKKASLLIESILLSVPIPVIYVAEEEDGHWAVIDGLQRLYSIKRFADNEFRLIGLEVLQELNGTQYSKLNTKALRILRNGVIRIIVVLQDSNPEIKYDIFLRLNRGAVNLNEQELRNCLYRGKFNDMLKEIRAYPQFLECLGYSSPHKRFNDAELALRFFALSENYNARSKKIKNYQNAIRTFLNIYIGSKEKISNAEIKRYEKKFKETVDKVYRIFGAKAFRRVDDEGEYESILNRALMDVIMLSFERTAEDKLIKHKKKIINLYKRLPAKDSYFYECITYATNDTTKLEYRINTWLEKLSEIVS